MKSSEIKKELEELGVDYPSRAPKSDLEALLKSTQESESDTPEVPEAPAEEEQVEKPKEVVAPEPGPYDGRLLGPSGLEITTRELKSVPTVANGRPLVHLSLIDGTTMILSEKDVKLQLKK